MIPSPAGPAPSPPPIAPRQALWQRAAGSISDTLGLADSEESASLDNRLARAIALHNTPSFDSLLHFFRKTIQQPDYPLPSALLRAIAPEKIYYLKALLDAGANPNEPVSRPAARRQLIHYAAERGSPETLSLLIQRSALLDLPDARGSTPLMLAASNASPEHVQALILAGANLNLRNLAGLSALDLSIRDFPARDPFISKHPSYKVEISTLSHFIKPLLPQARIAIALLNAGAELLDPVPILVFCARLREPRLLYALARRGFCSELSVLSEMKDKPSHPATYIGYEPLWLERLEGNRVPPGLWASYLQRSAHMDPQIEGFFDLALNELNPSSFANIVDEPKSAPMTAPLPEPDSSPGPQANSEKPANRSPHLAGEPDSQTPSLARKILSSRSAS